MPNLVQRTIGLGAIALLQSSLFSMMLPNRTLAFSLDDIFQRDSTNQFDICVLELLNQEISPEKASLACAEAVKPKELSECVVRVSFETAVTADEALVACFRVRQPVALADCATEISRHAITPFVGVSGSQALQPTALLALNNCRRSLLPQRYSECVVAATRQGQLLPQRAMETCIDAEDFPRVLFPSL